MDAPDPPPDDKDWTWVLTRRCPECGFAAAAVRRADLAVRIGAATASVAAVASAPGGATRPRADVWSPLEYACHVRDVCLVFDERARLMLGEDDPLFDNWDQDASAVAERYREQDPADVAAGLAAAAGAVTATFARVPDDAWGRRGRRSNGSSFTVDTLARYFLHDLEHHAHDVGR